jgi:hypothetical protein
MPKVNQAYVWGLTEAGEKSDKLWFGTAPNVHCLVISGFLGNLNPQTTQSWVCEYGASQYANDPSLIPGVTPVDQGVGDWRPSQAFVYDLKKRTLEEKTPANNAQRHRWSLEQNTGYPLRGLARRPGVPGWPGLAGLWWRQLLRLRRR